MIDKATLTELRQQLRGPVIAPSDPAYDTVRRVYNAMIDRHPGAIARVADVADVLTAVRLAAERNLLLAIRGGGHNAGGLGVCDDGLVLDLGALRYDPENLFHMNQNIVPEPPPSHVEAP